MSDMITALFNVFDPHKALPPNDPRYVECSEERGSVGLFEGIAHTIQRAKEQTCQLLSGHRGCGKTTELFRLKQVLLTQEPRHFVVYCETNSYIDLNDVEFTDILLAIVQQLWMETHQQGIELDPGSLRSFVDEVKGILAAPVSPTDISFGMGIAKLGFEIKNNPNNRQLVRAHLRPRATSLLEAVNEVLDLASERVKALGYQGILIIVDNLDRIIRNPLPSSNRNSLDALFVDASSYLRGLSCDLIYTLPPALLYSSSGAKLSSLYGTTPKMLPMIPVSTRQGTDDGPGIRKLVETLERRLKFVSSSLEEAFDSEETIIRLCTASGGYVRGLMTLVSGATTYVNDLPITSKAVEHAIRDSRNSYITSILTAKRWQILRNIAKNEPISETEDYLELLESFAVLEYRDIEGPWYQVNPIIREARQFTP